MAVAKGINPLISLALACCSLLPSAAGYGAPVNQQSNANYGGEVVVLDANSVTYPKRGAPYATRNECEAGCAANDKCNTWAFCDPPAGGNCGSGCDPTKYNFNPATPGDQTRFGQFGGGCVCPGSSSTDCSWPAKMCSWKKNVNQQPSIYSTSDNWWSGYNGKTIPQ